MHHPVRTRKRVWLLVTLGLTLAACGDDGGSTDNASTDDTSADEVEIGGTADPGGEVAWPAPEPGDVVELTDAAGVPLERREGLADHTHSHLDVFIDGEHRSVPAGIGIVIDDPNVEEGPFLRAPAYSLAQECDQPCIAPLHTHTISGVLHTESLTDETHTLGQFFEVWDVRLDEECVGEYCTSDTDVLVYVDGDEVPLADAADIELTDGKQIAIVIGSPPDRIPDAADFSQP